VTAHDIDIVHTRQCGCTTRMSLEWVRVLEADGKAFVSAMTLTQARPYREAGPWACHAWQGGHRPPQRAGWPHPRRSR
jgi:hypothetical protein